MLVLLVLGVAVSPGVRAAGTDAPPWGDAAVVPARVTSVVDGDTVDVRLLESRPGLGLRERVRYLGVNAPELYEPGYEEATLANSELVRFREAYLEFGPDLRDAHGRLLAYLWVKRDDEWVMVNEELLRRGLGRLLVFWPEEEKYYDRFLRAVAQAQAAKLGLWSKYPDPIPLEVVEANPLPYVLEAVTVEFEVEGLSTDEEGVSLWAQGSRYGFRAILVPGVGGALPFPPEKLPGARVEVRGELLWESFSGGPRIYVYIPEQISIEEER